MKEISGPDSLKKEHQELNAELRKIATRGDSIGELLRQLRNVFEAHLQKEEKYVMPLLSLLVPLARNDKALTQSTSIQIEDDLILIYNDLLTEHKQIREILRKIKSTALRNKDSDVVELTNAIELHASVEEEVIYPAALLIAKILKQSVSLKTS